MTSASVRFLVVSALLVLAACQAISDQKPAEQESIAEIDNRAAELEQAAEDAVNRQITEDVSEPAPAARQDFGNKAE